MINCFVFPQLLKFCGGEMVSGFSQQIFPFFFLRQNLFKKHTDFLAKANGQIFWLKVVQFKI